ncbi:unnamed protein product, partial [Brassica rapa]
AQNSWALLRYVKCYEPTTLCTEREGHLMLKAVKRLEAIYDNQKREDPSQKLIEK